MSLDFAGLYPAFLTPLTPDKHLAPDVAEKMLASLMSSSFAGTYIAGSTGEGMRLTVATRKQLLEVVKNALPTGKKLIAHVGTGTIEGTLELAEHAAKHGADAISSLPPVGDEDTVRDFYTKLAEESALPLIPYYFPKIAPTAFANPKDLLDICELPNVIGVKFTDFNFYLLQQLVKREKMMFNGYDEALAAGLLMGAQGGIGSTYNAWPEVYQEIFAAAQRGDWETARLWQAQGNSVLDVVLRYPFFPALREMVRLRGFDCGPLMSGESLTLSQRESLRNDLDRDIPAEVKELIRWPAR